MAVNESQYCQVLMHASQERKEASLHEAPAQTTCYISTSMFYPPELPLYFTMLLLHTLAYPLSGLLNTTFPDASVITEGSLEFLDHCGDIRSCRTVEEILYSCLAVMVACTWTSVHQNIPRHFGYPWRPTPVEQGSSFVVPQWMILFQNVSFMLLAFYAPEVVILWAARQWYSAWCIADKYKGKC